MKNARHARFVAEYLVDLNATQAYRRVYPKASAAAAEANGHRLLKNRPVAAAIAEGQRQRSAATQVTAEWVVNRLREEAENRGDGSSHAARVRALELLGKHLGMFVERVQVQEAVTLQIVEEIVDAPPGTRIDAA